MYMYTYDDGKREEKANSHFVFQCLFIQFHSHCQVPMRRHPQLETLIQEGIEISKQGVIECFFLVIFNIIISFRFLSFEDSRKTLRTVISIILF